MHVRPLAPDEADLAVDVLSDAFAGYPVMDFVLGRAARPDDPDLRRLVRLFVLARVLKGDPVRIVEERGEAVGAATVTPPEAKPAPDAFRELKSETWASLGDAARERYEAYGRAGEPHRPGRPHHYLNMIGVRRDRHGRGLARPLMDAVHGLASAHPGSQGVALATEVAEKVGLYRHFGYELLGRAAVSDGITTWVMMRKDG